MRPKLSLTIIAILLLQLCFRAGSQAQNRQALTCQGLLAPVEVRIDNWGVNHIYASNEHDLFFAQGYRAARDRLFQFEIWRRQATGTLSEILGARAINNDIGARLFRYRGDMKTELDHYHLRGAAIITAYVQGVNSYIAAANRHPQQLPIEFRLLGITPGPWTPEIVISRHNGIRTNADQELNIGMAVSRVGDAKVRELMWFPAKDPLLQLDSAIDGSLLSARILDAYTASRQDPVFSTKDLAGGPSLSGPVHTTSNLPEGSNNWVIAGSRTASGYPILADDPHRKIALPSLRYMVHLVAPGWNVIGAGEPEIPGVSIGHNEYGAWGITVFETDVEDLYVYDLNPSNLRQYRYKDKWTDMTEIRENLPVKNGRSLDIMLRYTIHGPVTYIDSVHHKAYAVRCAWLEPGCAPYLSSLRIDQSDSWTSFRTACSYSRLPALNMVWADRKGNIGWQVVGAIPVRRNFSGLVPVSGDGRYEWSGTLPVLERPHILNPKKGFWATANQQLTPPAYQHWDAMGYTWPDAFRGDRLNQVLAGDTAWTVEKIARLQTDYYSTPASLLIPLLKDCPLTSPLAISARDLLLHWDFIMDRHSVAAGIYDRWEREIIAAASASLMPLSIRGLLNIQLTKIIGWVRSADTIFGKDPQRARDRFVRETFESAVAALREKLGDSLNTWAYGQDKYKHSQFTNLLSALADPGWQEKMNTTALPRGGNAYTIGATGNTDNQTSGASFRIIVDEGDWDRSLMINSPGQSGNPDSPHYKDLFATWANDRYFPACFSRPKVLSVTRQTLLLRP